MASVFFHVNRQPIQQLIQNAGLFSGFYQIAVQIIEVQRILSERRTQGGSGFHIGAYVVEEFADTRVSIASANDVKGLQQWDSGFHHGGQLTGEQGNVLGLD